ncbi:MAG: 5-formyltetrahydrofolate cyclo-ligase [Bacillota bacterium]
MKNTLRKEILEKRKAMSETEIATKSDLIFSKLKTLELYKHAVVVMVYLDFRNEVQTQLIIKDLLSSGKKAIIPISVPETKHMILSQLMDPEVELTEGTYGILEPKKEFIREVDKNTLDLILVPGVVFDRKGYRIGYGGGYYDRFLDSLTKTVPSIALAFDLQVIDEVPHDFHDYPVSYIVTETEVSTCK